MNALYPDPPPVRRVRVPAGPHELTMITVASANDTVYVGCRCTADKIPVKVDAPQPDLQVAWRVLRHDQARGPVPWHLPGPNARYPREGET